MDSFSKSTKNKMSFSFLSIISEFVSPDLKTHKASSNASSNGSELSLKP
jgi:hypothetical protein